MFSGRIFGPKHEHEKNITERQKLLPEHKELPIFISVTEKVSTQARFFSSDTFSEYFHSYCMLHYISSHSKCLNKKFSEAKVSIYSLCGIVLRLEKEAHCNLFSLRLKSYYNCLIAVVIFFP